MTTIPCPDRARLKDLLDGALPSSEQEALLAHLESCPACQRVMEELAAGRDTWAGVARQLGGPTSSPDAALAEALEQAREARQSGAGTFGSDVVSELPLNFLAPSDDPAHLGKLDHYEVLEAVGRGAMGCVFRAFDEKLRRVVAIKVMSPQLATSASARARFVREGQAAAAICHEHVVAVHAVESTRKLPYLVMHYVGGVSLQERLDRTGPLQVKEILRIGMQAAQGLAAAHAQGLVHRDIKPANILLENGVERVKITDFGLARAVDDSSLTQTGVIAGSPQFMAPEQARGDAIDHRADLFSLGSVLYTLCTGRPPFRASTTMAVLKRVCEEAPRPIREINGDIPDWLVAIIEKLMAKDPAERFATAGEVAALLGQHLAHLQQPDRAPRPSAVARPAHSAPTIIKPQHSRPPGAVRPAVVNAIGFGCLGAAAVLLILDRLGHGPFPDTALYARVAVFAGFAYLLAIGILALLQRLRDRSWKTSLVGPHPFVVLLAAAGVLAIDAYLMVPPESFDLQKPSSTITDHRAGRAFVTGPIETMTMTGKSIHSTAPAARQPSAAEFESLEQLVEIAEQELQLARGRHEAATVPFTEVVLAEIRWKEAQVQLAEARRDQPEVIRLLEELVKLHEVEVETMQRLVENAVAPASGIFETRKALLEARTRLERARAAEAK